jgi:GABA(A) receptor-associated protein
MPSFQATHSFDTRLAEFERIRQRFPGRIPIIVEKASNSADVPYLQKQKFLAPNTMNVGQFVYVIRKNMQLPPEKALFIFCNNMLPTTATLLQELYNEHRDPDGFMYIKYSSESTFGMEACRPHTPRSSCEYCRSFA